MMPVEACAGARPVQVLITNEGKRHSADQWARAVLDGLVTIQDGATESRRREGESLRAKVFALLKDLFELVEPRMSAVQIERLAGDGLARLTDIFSSSPWAMNVAEPTVRAMILAHLFRNLMSAANLALLTE